VNKEGVETGELSKEALIGFVEVARWLGYSVPDENAFLQKCQEECFEWGRQSQST
jgi:hypothetical protein